LFWFLGNSKYTKKKRLFSILFFPQKFTPHHHVFSQYSCGLQKIHYTISLPPLLPNNQEKEGALCKLAIFPRFSGVYLFSSCIHAGLIGSLLDFHQKVSATRILFFGEFIASVFRL